MGISWNNQWVWQGFGVFSPSEKDVFWTHPFVELDYGAYSFAEASHCLKLESRTFPLMKANWLYPDASYFGRAGGRAFGYWRFDGNVLFAGSKIWGNYTKLRYWIQIWQKNSKNHQFRTGIKKVTSEPSDWNKTLISLAITFSKILTMGRAKKLKALLVLLNFNWIEFPTLETSKSYLDAGIKWSNFAGQYA